MDLQYIVLNLPLALGFLGSFYFFFHYKHFLPQGAIIGWFVVFTFACESLGAYYASLAKNNLFIVHIYTLGTFVVFSLFFQRLFRSLKVFFLKTWHIFLGIVLIVLNSIFIEAITEYNAYSKTVVQVFIILMCIYAYSLMTIKDYSEKDKYAIRMFVAAILLSCSLTTTLYLFSNQIMHMEKDSQQTIWMVNVASNSVVQILYLIGLVKLIQITKKNINV